MKNLILLFISLFIFSCDSDDNPISVSNEIDVDWFLIRTPDFNDSYYTNDGEVVIDGLGYFFHFTESSGITNLNLILNESDYSNSYSLSDGSGILSFDYQNQNYSFDLSDSYDSSNDLYRIDSFDNDDSFFPIQRMIYNIEMNYFTIFGGSGFFGVQVNSSNPNQLIDYR